MSFSKMRIRTKPKGMESRLFSKTIENSFNVPETVFCFARSMTFLSRNCSSKPTLINHDSIYCGQLEAKSLRLATRRMNEVLKTSRKLITIYIPPS